MTGCGCMSGGKRRRTRRTRRRSRRTKRKMSKHHRRRYSRHRRSRRSRHTRRRRGGRYNSPAQYMGVAAPTPRQLQIGGNSYAVGDFAITGGYKKKKRGGTTTKTHLHPE